MTNIVDFERRANSPPDIPDDDKQAASSATWKFDFLDTVNADPKANGLCLGVIKAYLHFASKSRPLAFCSLDDLCIRTGSSRPAVTLAKKKLVSLGYLVAEYETDEGATMYRLKNARKEIIDDHLRIAREKLAADRRDRKKRERGVKKAAPLNDDWGETILHPDEKESLPNTLDVFPGDYLYETETDYQKVKDGDDQPFSIPSSDQEADEILAHAQTDNALILKSLRAMLMRGELTPSFLTQDTWKSVASIKKATHLHVESYASEA